MTSGLFHIRINGDRENKENGFFALMTSGSTTFQALGTNVYDSHINANLEIPTNSGSISK